MIKLTYQIVFKEGFGEFKSNEDIFFVEVEPHEYKETYDDLCEIMMKFNNQFGAGIVSNINLTHNRGHLMFSTCEVSRLNITGIDELKLAIS